MLIVARFLLLCFLIVAALLIDGNLARDIFDYRIDTFREWIAVVAIFFVIAFIAYGEFTKKIKPPDGE
ncbi:MAG: hypothetical protein G3M78_05600 [Candidatus Nitrohelix vancouverensis]|uniref:Uncharacterized protein n=1 Tax=Candidatus Nitrohelix vancouverensis TaxID=2705534 RepID=A0A7T0C1Q0_9BACT|nr:MAG: hypothetical protein G3M78_05600 [Candidatus Nitrohelix vancouverensis]